MMRPLEPFKKAAPRYDRPVCPINDAAVALNMPRSSRKSAPRRDRGEDPRRVADEDPRANADVDDGEWEEDGCFATERRRPPPRPPGCFFCACQRFDEDDGGDGVDDLMSILGYPPERRFGESTTEVPLSGDDDEVRAVHVQAAYEDAADGGDDAPATLATRAPPPLLLGEGPAAPVSADERAQAAAIYDAYAGFFDHISFRKGWKRPPFPRRDADPLFRRVARVAAMARSRDLRRAGFALRQPDGAARDWMHDAPSPADSPNAFLRGLLHATFQDANGYVEGLDAVAVERFRRRYDAIPSAG